MKLDGLSIFFFTVALGWTIFTLGRLRDLLYVRALPPVDANDEPGPPPRVSVIVAARDEEHRIERSIGRLLEQQGVDLELIVVDDRSTDATTTILARLAMQNPRLRVLRVDTLPDGWLGKPHACHLGAAAARGEWILFTDADVWLAPDVVRRAVSAARRATCDHVCLLPGESETTLPARALLLDFGLGMLFFTSRANRDRPSSFVGVGAFNLVRAEAYRAVGGHEPLRLEIIDDMMLGLSLRQAGYRTRGFGAPADVEVQWASTAAGMIRALEKNHFALLGYNLPLALAAIAGMSAMVAGAAVGPFVGGPAGLAAGLALLPVILPCWILSRRGGWGTLPALLAPVMLAWLIAALAHSTLSAVRRGGIRWRGTFYPLAVLRAGRFRPRFGNRDR